MSGKTIHGLSRTAEYRAWQTMRLRCTVPSNPAFRDYGARGITICARWMESPATFVLDVGPKPSARHEIDRIDNDGGYWCGDASCADCGPARRERNVRWATRHENCRNRRSNRVIVAGGVARNLVEWSEIAGISPDVITKRLDAGWPTEKAVSASVRPKSPKGTRAPQYRRRHVVEAL